MTGVVGYRDVVANHTTRRLLTASVVSSLGDFVGSGALLVLAYERAGAAAVGPAAFLAATGAGALVVAFGGSGQLDRVSRRSGLVVSELLGALALLLPVLVPTLWSILLAAFVIGMVRSAAAGFRHGVLADGVPQRLRSGLLGLIGTADQLGQVIGYVAGSALALGIGAEVALGMDAATFVVAAAVLAGLRDDRPRRGAAVSPLLGMRTILSHPQLRLLTTLVVVSAAASALPETLATSVVATDDPRLPFVLAAGPAGGVLGYAVAGRLATTTRFTGQLVHLTLLGVATLAGLLADGPLSWLAVNVAMGIGAAWIVGPQVSFVRLAPPERMAQVTTVMVALVATTEGLWVLLAGVVADTVGPAASYGGAGAVVLAGAVAGWVVRARRAESGRRWDP